MLHFQSQKPPEDAPCFVPITAPGPFEVLQLGSDDTKGLAVTDMPDKRVTIGKLQDDRSTISIEICKA